MGQQKPPKAPNAAKLYEQGIQSYLQYQPQLLSAEEQARMQYDPQRIAQQQALQAQYGQNQYAQQLAALQQIDPTGTALRKQQGEAISRDLALGTQLSPEMEQQLNSYIRGAQTSRGGGLGDASVSAEGLFKGQAALQMYQQRLQNAGNFVSGPTPEQQLLAIQPVTADRSSAYVNPNAGYQGQQFGLQNYQNMLAQYQLSGGGQNPWLSGAANGAQYGSVGGPYGAIGGAVVGGVLGGTTGNSAFSDERLKEKVVNLYKDARTGLTKKLFQYKGDPQKFVGYMAQDVLEVAPEHVGEQDGFLTVSPEFAPIPV